LSRDSRVATRLSDVHLRHVTWTLDAAALQQSLSARSASVHLIASLLSAPQNRMKAAEFIGLLKDLFTDIDLVHAAYYSRDSGIRQVAAWIEMSPEEKADPVATFGPPPQD